MGTIFVIDSETARGVSRYSVYPEEAEVLFRAGTQFQVVKQVGAGLKSLIEVAMGCSLENARPAGVPGHVAAGAEPGDVTPSPVPPLTGHGVQTRLGTSTRQLRRDHRSPGPTECCGRCRCFLLSSDLTSY